MVPQLAKNLAIGLLVTLMALSLNGVGAAASTHKRFIIHVPLKMKSHHHTHTVYTHIHHGGGKVEYKVLGYSHHGLEGHGEAAKHAVETGHPAGDIVFNHYAARNGEDHLQDEFSSDYEDWEP